MNTNVLKLSHSFEYHLVTIAGAVIVVSLLIYAYGVTATIFNIASVKGYENAARNNRADIGVYETRYLNAERSLTVERAHELGLTETKKVSHLALEAPVLLTFNE
jgi:hypothetical protein